MFSAECDDACSEQENPDDGCSETVNEEEVVKSHPADQESRDGQRRNHGGDKQGYLEIVGGEFVSLMRQHLDQRQATVESESETNLAEESHDAQFGKAVGMMCGHDEVEERRKRE